MGHLRKKLSPSKEGREHRLFFKEGKLVYGVLAGRKSQDNEKPNHKILQITAVNGGDNGRYVIGQINNTSCRMVVDTEANVSIIGEDLDRNSKVKIIWTPPCVSLQTVTVAENRKFRFGLIDCPDPDGSKAEVLIASLVADLSKSAIPMRVANISDKTRTIQEGEFLGISHRLGQEYGSTRFCVDYHQLNDVTKKDNYLLPSIDDTLDTLAGNTRFSTLDLMSGYWQVEIHPEDKEKTAITTGQEPWKFKVMPFGLCKAHATFERLMETVLGGLLYEACLVYLDDIIIVGHSFEEHLKPISCISFRRKVFEQTRLRSRL
ncbi:retrovirus-related Pol polyprotein from transposon 17.6 [Trichonephila clavipes]|nr:retrovirus-related Pol polyprotein from transposon 17.6 [Trichonephila clavipes]